jgi:hypothetical protein
MMEYSEKEFKEVNDFFDSHQEELKRAFLEGEIVRFCRDSTIEISEKASCWESIFDKFLLGEIKPENALAYFEEQLIHINHVIKTPNAFNFDIIQYQKHENSKNISALECFRGSLEIMISKIKKKIMSEAQRQGENALTDRPETKQVKKIPYQKILEEIKRIELIDYCEETKTYLFNNVDYPQTVCDHIFEKAINGEYEINPDKKKIWNSFMRKNIKKPAGGTLDYFGNSYKTKKI